MHDITRRLIRTAMASALALAAVAATAGGAAAIEPVDDPIGPCCFNRIEPMDNPIIWL